MNRETKQGLVLGCITGAAICAIPIAYRIGKESTLHYNNELVCDFIERLYTSGAIALKDPVTGREYSDAEARDIIDNLRDGD